jgi:hypothetical protein
MIEAKVTLSDNLFIAGLQRMDRALVGFKDRVMAFSQSFQLFGELEEHFDKMRQALDFGSRMSDMATQTGASAGEMAVLSQMFENTGLGADEAGMFVGRLQKALSGLNEEGATTATAFRQLHVDINQLRAAPMLEQVRILQEAFGRIQNVNDRAKIASELFGRSGMTDLRFLVKPEGVQEAMTQVGGLKTLLDQNAEGFSRLSIALNAIQLKWTQFYAGFATGLAGNTKTFADWLNKLDLTKIGESWGHFAREAGEVVAALKPFLPLIEILAAEMGVSWLAGTKMGAGLVAAFMSPGASLAVLVERLGAAKALLSTIAFAPAIEGVTALTAAIGTLNTVMLVSIAAFAGFKLGEGLMESIFHYKAMGDAANRQAALTQIGADTESEFEQKRGKMHSEQERGDLLKDIDAAMDNVKKGMSDAVGKGLPTEYLNHLMETGHDQLHALSAMHDMAAKDKLAPMPEVKGSLDPWMVTGKTPMSHLERVGGGMNMLGAGSDPMLNEMRRHTQILQNVLTAITGSPTASRPPVVHATS